ncbi:unnamed protein product [Sphagnum troendelagicum]|uniref:Uncharacterized protein n=1 Tax=Sphagnum troendelagicum TaxID=128251 RepID=A0ABP0T9Y8_9BRYO
MMGLGSEHTLALHLWTTNKPCKLFNAVVNEENDCFVNCLHGVFSLCATSFISRMSRCIKLLPGSCIPSASMVHSLILISISIARISCNRKSRQNTC